MARQRSASRALPCVVLDRLLCASLAVCAIAACGSAASPRVTIVVAGGERPGFNIEPTQVLSVHGINRQQCRKWELAPLSQGGGVVELHVMTTKSQSQRVATDVRRLPGVYKVSIAPVTAFDVRQLPGESGVPLPEMPCR